MKKLKILYYILIIFLGIIILALIVSVFPVAGNYKIMIVQSGSMEPAIKMGSIVAIRPVEEYKINDVITFGPHTRTLAPTSHRIHDIRLENGQPVYITKGDANNAPDSQEIFKKDILGKVMFSLPYLGFAVDFAKKPVGFALIIIIPAAIIIGDEIKKIFREIKKKKAS